MNSDEMMTEALAQENTMLEQRLDKTSAIVRDVIESLRAIPEVPVKDLVSSIEAIESVLKEAL